MTAPSEQCSLTQQTKSTRPVTITIAAPRSAALRKSSTPLPVVPQERKRLTSDRNRRFGPKAAIRLWSTIAVIWHVGMPEEVPPTTLPKDRHAPNRACTGLILIKAGPVATANLFAGNRYGQGLSLIHI